MYVCMCIHLNNSGLDRNNLKHYRPVSNVSFVSKMLEKNCLAVASKHLFDNGFLDIHQSAHRKDHSTETAVLSVLDGLLVTAVLSVLDGLLVTAVLSVLDGLLVTAVLSVLDGLLVTAVLSVLDGLLAKADQKLVSLVGPQSSLRYA